MAMDEFGVGESLPKASLLGVGKKLAIKNKFIA